MFEYNEMPRTYAKLATINAGYESDKQRARMLEDDFVYEVEWVDMGQSSTSVKLRGFRMPFNSTNLKFYNKDLEVIDIYNMPEYNPYMKMRNIE